MYYINMRNRSLEKIKSKILKAVDKYSIDSMVISTKEIEILKYFKDIVEDKIFIKPEGLQVDENLIKILDENNFVYNFKVNSSSRYKEKSVNRISKVHKAALLNSIKLLSKGEKNAVHSAVLAYEKKMIDHKNIISISGEDEKIDTGLVIKPAKSSQIYNCKISEVIFRPL